MLQLGLLLHWPLVQSPGCYTCLAMLHLRPVSTLKIVSLMVTTRKVAKLETIQHSRWASRGLHAQANITLYASHDVACILIVVCSKVESIHKLARIVILSCLNAM